MISRILYIGQYSIGTTSKLRADTLIKLLPNHQMDIIDTHIPFYNTNKFIRSFGFRYKLGPLVKNINDYIKQSLNQEAYNLIWVDKAVFISPETTRLLKAKTSKLIHFTPDPAFTYHRSKLFFNSLNYYDYVVTTKSYELDYYKVHLDKTKLLYASQGFDETLHQPFKLNFNQKKGLVFIGHFENERAQVIEMLLKANIKILLAGIKWQTFAKKHEDNANLVYLGDGVYDKAYAETLQHAKIAWGAISKRIPELHTTRTFEIPACGTALLTERNEETTTFFNEDEAIFYDNDKELIAQIMYFMSNDAELKSLTRKGYLRVTTSGYDYKSILAGILKQIFE